ncbi:unnamed protein product [Schistocephalus solidus]|uniref:Uncharacterized protein n=1 Tax=Schistocephalus solidus TaxID=70667 RepID=A0A3P7CB03_SCHSO|nr:unnamed protein product [Schistocephalus solidus]
MICGYCERMSKKDSYKSEGKYRAYTASIEKCLKAFEYSSEWADLIASLGRLIKLIQQNSRYSDIPKKRLLGKRLSQCLHPALPAGVHCKTLECFDLIFRIMGTKSLAKDVAIYGTALFGLLGPSAMTVKPPLFDIFEIYFLPLGHRLRPAFLGLLQGLLPGLEEGAEFFDRGTAMMDHFCLAVGSEFFYTSLWQASHSKRKCARVLANAPSIRHYGTAFILSHFNKRKSISSQAFLFGESKPIFLNSIRCLLSDNVVLVQRDILDFLILALPVHVATASQAENRQHPLDITPDEMSSVVCSALSVLLRRDASLNRRLFLWLLGGQIVESPDLADDLRSQSMTVARLALTSDPTNSGTVAQGETDSAVQVRYFKTYCRDLVIHALRCILRSSLLSVQENAAQARVASSRPFRLMAGLLDRSEVGSLVVEHVLMDFLYFTLEMYNQLASLSSTDGSASEKWIVSKEVQLPNSVRYLLLEHEANQRLPGSRCRRSSSSTNTPAAAFDDAASRSQGSKTVGSVANAGTVASSGGARLVLQDEFMRVADVFFANLESAFLWRFVQTEFTLLLRHSAEEKGVRRTVPSDIQTDVQLPFVPSHPVNLRTWSQVVQFLLQQLPIDTYPEVLGHFIPELASRLTRIVIDRLNQHAGSATQEIPLTELSDILALLTDLIRHIQGHVVNMFDYSVVELSRASQGSTAPSVRSPTDQQHHRDFRLIASTVGDVRRALGAFCRHVLGVKLDDVKELLSSLNRHNCPSLVDLNTTFFTSLHCCALEEDKVGSRRAVLIDLFAQFCRLVVDMCNFPLAQVSDAIAMPQSDAAGSPSSLDELLCSEGSFDPKTHEFLLPEWLSHLVAISTFANNFDLKAISMLTLLDLIHASSSIHGWSSSASSHHANLLLLPVLSSTVLHHLAHELLFFPLAGVSLWFFLDSASPTHFDDAACLLLRIQSLAPTTLHVRRPKSSPRTSPSTAVTSTDSVVQFWLDTEMPCSNIVEDFFLSQMLSPDPQIRAESHDRFALLWHLLRAQSMNNTRLGINGGSQSPSGTPSWRRSAMGLPSLDDTPIGCRGPISANRLHRAAFDKCILVLLDNLDENTQCAISRESLFDRRSETTAKPVDSTTKSPRCCSPLTATPVDNLASVLRQRTHEWLSRALLTGQIGCVLAPLLAALLHPATAKVSLVALHNHKRALLKTKAREERRLARRRQRALGARPAAKPQQQRRKEKPKAPSPDSTTAPEAGEQKEQETGLTAEWQIVTVTESGTAVADFNNDLVDADTDTESDTDREIAEEERRIYAVSGGPGGEVVYHRRRSVDTEAAAAASNGYAKGSKGHKKHDVFAEEYKPIDVMTSLQTGDNDHDGRDRNNSTPDELRRSFIRALLGELLSRDTKASGNSLEMPVVSSSSSPEQRYMMTADFLSQFPFLVLPLHQHLLVYLHKFDCNQVLYALSRIRAILKTDLADQFLLVLAATPTAHQRESSTTSPKPSQGLSKFVFCNFPPICGTSLPDLLARHRRSLLGGDFSAQSTLEETTYIQQQAFPSLLDVLIYACVQCMSAVLPRTMKINGVECKSDTSGDQSGSSDSASSSAKTVSDSEVHAVLHIRLLAAEVLNHITKALTSLDTHSTEATKNASRPGQSEKKPKLEKLFASANDSHWWINTVLQRTSLPQATLHSLGVCIEFAHIRQSRFRALPPTALSRLPVCLHLLAANDYACTCSDSVFKTHMETLLDLTRNLLQLTDETPVWTTHRHGGSKSLNSRRSSVSSPIKRVGALATGHVWPWDKFAMPEGTFQLKHITRLLNALPPFFRQEPLLLSLCMSRFQQVPACLAAQGILFSALRLGLSSAAPSSARTPNQPGALLLPLNAFDLSAAPLYEIPSHPELHPIWFRFILNSLSYWGSGAPFLVHTVISQLSAALTYIADLVSSDVLDVANSSPPTSSPLVLARAELAHVFPHLLRSVADLWFALNQSENLRSVVDIADCTGKSAIDSSGMYPQNTVPFSIHTGFLPYMRTPV